MVTNICFSHHVFHIDSISFTESPLVIYHPEMSATEQEMIRKNIKKNKDFIARSIDLPKEMVKKMLRNDPSDSCKWLSIKSQYERNRFLLEKLCEGDGSVLQTFIELLNSTGQESIANLCLDGMIFLYYCLQ